MLTRLSQWPEAKRLHAGVWFPAILTWCLYAGQYLVRFILTRTLASFFRHIHFSSWSWVLTLASALVFCLACAVAGGLITAFFWMGLSMDENTRRRLTFNSVAITWAPALLYCCGWCVLWLPFLAYLAVFRATIARAIPFWQSNRPRQWLGDFSERGDSTEGNGS